MCVGGICLTRRGMVYFGASIHIFVSFILFVGSLIRAIHLTTYEKEDSRKETLGGFIIATYFFILLMLGCLIFRATEQKNAKLLGWTGGIFITLETFAFVVNLMVLSPMGSVHDEYGFRNFGFSMNLVYILLSCFFLLAMMGYCATIIMYISRLKEDGDLSSTPEEEGINNDVDEEEEEEEEPPPSVPLSRTSSRGTFVQRQDSTTHGTYRSHRQQASLPLHTQSVCSGGEAAAVVDDFNILEVIKEAKRQQQLKEVLEAKRRAVVDPLSPKGERGLTNHSPHPPARRQQSSSTTTTEPPNKSRTHTPHSSRPQSREGVLEEVEEEEGEKEAEGEEGEPQVEEEEEEEDDEVESVKEKLILRRKTPPPIIIINKQGIKCIEQQTQTMPQVPHHPYPHHHYHHQSLPPPPGLSHHHSYSTYLPPPNPPPILTNHNESHTLPLVRRGPPPLPPPIIHPPFHHHPQFRDVTSLPLHTRSVGSGREVTVDEGPRNNRPYFLQQEYNQRGILSAPSFASVVVNTPPSGHHHPPHASIVPQRFRNPSGGLAFQHPLPTDCTRTVGEKWPDTVGKTTGGSVLRTTKSGTLLQTGGRYDSLSPPPTTTTSRLLRNLQRETSSSCSSFIDPFFLLSRAHRSTNTMSSSFDDGHEHWELPRVMALSSANHRRGGGYHFNALRRGTHKSDYDV